MVNAYLPEAHQHNSQYYAYIDFKNIYFHHVNISITIMCSICVMFFGDKSSSLYVAAVLRVLTFDTQHSTVSPN